MTPSKITLFFANPPGRGELPRLLFIFGGVAFVDKSVEIADVPALKPKLPLGQLPVVEVDGKVFCQSGAIQRYAAKLSGLYPKDPVEALHADMAAETLTELHASYLKISYGEKDPAARAEKFKTLGDEAVPKYFGVLESMVLGKFFGGDKISFADVQVFNVVHSALNASLPDLSLEAYPKLLAIVAAVKENPNIATYLAQQAHTSKVWRTARRC